MIKGAVRAREARIQLTVRGLRGRRQDIEAIIDTGYTGWLTLPPELVSSLGLRWRSFIGGLLADGSENIFDVYEAKVLWDGKDRRVSVFEADAEALVGMALLNNHELKIEVRAGGKVTIKRLPRRRRL